MAQILTWQPNRCRAAFCRRDSCVRANTVLRLGDRQNLFGYLPNLLLLFCDSAISRVPFSARSGKLLPNFSSQTAHVSSTRHPCRTSFSSSFVILSFPSLLVLPCNNLVLSTPIPCLRYG